MCSQTPWLSLVPVASSSLGAPNRSPRALSPRAPDNVFSLGVPVLGICYGMQTMAAQLGGDVSSSQQHEFGHAVINVAPNAQLLADLHDASGASAVWMSHGDKVVSLPPGFVVTASTDSAPIAAMEDPERRLFAVQFHPEVTHTEHGAALLERFCRDICACDGLWTAANIVEDAIRQIRAAVGSDRVVLGLSGGVDSSVSCGAVVPCDRRSTVLCVCRQRAVAQGRAS